MKRIYDDISKVNSLPDVAVLTVKQAAALTGLSTRTLWIMVDRGDGPRRVLLTTKRHGYQLGPLKRWIEERTITTGNAA
jgi:predicted DNA-binding transcriptional regulator AlpA